MATFTGQRLKPRGIVFTGIGLMGVGVFATVLQAPATIRTGFLDMELGEQLKDVLPFAIVHLLPLLGALIVALLAGFQGLFILSAAAAILGAVAVLPIRSVK